MSPESTITDYIAYYTAHSEETISVSYQDQLHVAVRLLDRHAGHKVKLAELSDEMINGYVDWLREIGRAPATVRGRRNSVLALWRHAYMERILDTGPQRIRKIRARRRLPTAWSREEVAELVRVAVADDHVWPLNGCRRGMWLASLICAGWDSALRLGDLLRLECRQVATSGPIRVIQHKTGDEVLVQLSQQTRGLMDACIADCQPRRLVWPLWASRDAFYIQMRKLVAAAGITPGTFRYIRRGAITDVELHGGNGTTLAGHRNRRVTEEHYLDAAQLAHVQRRPEPIDILKIRA